VPRGGKARTTAEVRVLGPWQVQVPGSGEPVSQFEWQTGVAVPWSLVWDGDVAHFVLGDDIAYDLALPKNAGFDTIVLHAQAGGSGYSMRARALVLNVSAHGIGGPLPHVALPPGPHPPAIPPPPGRRALRRLQPP